MTRPPPRLLLVRTGAMGDVLHALPAVAALRQQRPELEIGWIVDPRWAPLLVDATGEGAHVSRVHLAETRQWSQAPFSAATLRSLLALRRSLRAFAYPLAVDVQGTLRSGVLSWLAGGEDRVGFEAPRERPARLFYTRALPREGTHVVEQNAALLGAALGIPLRPQTPCLLVYPEAETWAERVLAPGGRMALLAVTAGWGAKEWPVARYAALARDLAAEGWTVLLNAAHAADPTPLAVAAASGTMGGRPVAQVVSPGLAELIALTRQVSLVVGGDTGPVHLAAALGVPTVALFGPTDPARTGPWGPGRIAVLRSPQSKTSHKRVHEVEPGLATLAVGEVLDAVARVTEPDALRR